MTSPVQFCIINPLIGQLRSNDDVITSIYVSPITFDWEEIETLGRCQRVRLVKTHLLICNLTYLGHSVTLTLDDLRSKLSSDLSITKYMSRSALTRERRWWQNRSISNSVDVINEKLSRKTNPGNRTFFVWPDLEGQQLTKIGQLAHHWIRNIPIYPLVFVAKLHHTRVRDGAGGCPPPPGAFSFREKGGAGEV